MQVLVGVKLLLTLLLHAEGTDGGQTLQRGAQVGKHRAATWQTQAGEVRWEGMLTTIMVKDFSLAISISDGCLVVFVGLLVGCLMSQQQASVSQGRICSDNCMCCHTEVEAADQTFYLTQSQYTDTGPTSPSADPTTPGAWQGSHRSANF